METKANYVAVGAFTVLIVAAAIAFVLWFTRVDTGGESAQLNIVIEGSVTGLSVGSPVKFNGIDVGQVRSIDFVPDNPRQVIARAIVRRDLPINDATTAVLAFTGLTGIAHIELEGGNPDMQNVFAAAAETGEAAQVIADPSAVNDLVATAQDIFARTDSVLTELETFVADARGPLTETLQNTNRITEALANNADQVDQFLAGIGALGQTLEGVSGSLNTTLAGVDGLIQAVPPDDVEAIVADVRSFTGNLNRASEDLETISQSATEAIASLQQAGARVEGTLERVDAIVTAVDPEAVSGAVSGLSTASDSIAQTADDVRAIIATIDPDEAREIVADIRNLTGNLSSASNEFETLAATATETLTGLQETGEGLGRTITRVDEIAQAIEPDIVAGAVESVGKASDAISGAAEDIAELTDSFGGRSEEIDTIFSNVTELAQRLNAASVRVDGVLAKAETFLGSGEGGADSLIAEAQATLQSFRAAANTLNARLDSITTGLDDFSNRGLSDVRLLVNDTRRSITRIEEAISSLERNPQRLLFGGEGDVKRFPSNGERQRR